MDYQFEQLKRSLVRFSNRITNNCFILVVFNQKFVMLFGSNIIGLIMTKGLNKRSAPKHDHLAVRLVQVIDTMFPFRNHATLKVGCFSMGNFNFATSFETIFSLLLPSQITMHNLSPNRHVQKYLIISNLLQFLVFSMLPPRIPLQ